MQDRALEVIDLGQMEYGACWELQRRLHAQVLTGEHPGAILLVEHDPVVTLGRHADPKFMCFGEKFLKEKGIGIYAVDRGGEVTAHEPGQLVIYPIIALEQFSLLPKNYVTLLEEAMIEALAELGIEAHGDAEHPGVWIGLQKIGAVGVRIKDRVSMHGLALNVLNSMEIFQWIVPCGLSDRGVTSVSVQLAAEVPLSKIKSMLSCRILTKLQARRYHQKIYRESELERSV